MVVFITNIKEMDGKLVVLCSPLDLIARLRFLPSHWLRSAFINSVHLCFKTATTATASVDLS